MTRRAHKVEDGRDSLPLQRRGSPTTEAGEPALMQLQQAVGNRAVHAKLELGAADSPLEAEADEVADRVAGPNAAAGPSAPSPASQPSLDNSTASDITAATGGGRALAPDVRTEMEGELGTDLSGVRIHTGSKADELSRSIEAKAFTAGSDVFFKDGNYDPGSSSGKHLLAHELTHVAQQAPAAVNASRDHTDSTVLRAPDADSSDVQQWAQDEYRTDSKRTLICSMTSDGKIGSVYFEGEGRIRTTHAGGPKESAHRAQTLQFNIKQADAFASFKAEHPKEAASGNPRKSFNRWLASTLDGPTPTWAQKIESPEDAVDVSEGSPGTGTKLFEIFKKINGTIEGWHPSRGAAAKMETDKQTIAVLQAAISHLDANEINDPKARNEEFYEFVKTRLPNFAPLIRDPRSI